MSIIAGIRTKDGYLFINNGVTGDCLDDGAIVKLNKYCGALIVTKGDDRLKKVKEILKRCLAENGEKTDGLSDSLIKELILFFRIEFQKDISYRSMPLPFLFLIVGINLKQQGCLEYVFIRNRVTEVIKKEGKKEFVTEFDINPTIPARDIFYGDSNFIQYLAQQLPCYELPMDMVKLLACLSMSEFQQIDKPLSKDIRMASLSEGMGFKWIGTEEILSLADKAKKADDMFTNGFNSFWSGLKTEWI